MGSKVKRPTAHADILEKHICVRHQLMDLIDSHAHLDMLKDFPGALDRARQAGVSQVITIGIDLKTSMRAAEMARTNEGVFCTVGLHPHDAAQANEGLWPEMKRLAREAGAVAVGECGLDFYRDLSPRPLQREVFQRQIEMATELELPLVIHDRQAHQEVAGIMRDMDAGKVGGVVHCFSGDWALARQILDMNFSLGIDGPVTYGNSKRLREVVRAAPMDRILLETDCPYLTPVPHRGKPNEPAYLVHIAAEIAGIKGLSVEDVTLAASQNTRRIFGLPPRGE